MNQPFEKRRSTPRLLLALMLTLAVPSAIGCGDDDDAPAEGDEDGDPADGDPADGDPADGDPADGDPADGDPADGDPADGDPADGDPADGDPAEPVRKLVSVVFDGDDHFYAAGDVLTVTGEGSTEVAQQLMLVARYNLDGSLDTSFDDDGMVEVDVREDSASASATTQVGKGIALQSDGKIVIVGTVVTGKVTETVESVTGDVDEIDIAIARLNSDGSLDNTFSSDGKLVMAFGAVQKIRLNNAGDALQGNNEDAYAVAVDADDRAVVFARGLAEGAPGNGRTDMDRFVLRFTDAGELDTTFAGDGKFSVDGTGDELDDNVRNGLVLADGKILSAGYTSVDGHNNIVLIRLNDDGTADDSFADEGVAVANPLGPQGMAEAYGVTVGADGDYVTVGYGKNDVDDTTEVASIVATKFQSSGASAGDLADWGTDGASFINAVDQVEQGRNIASLSDGRLVVVGNATTASSSSDGFIAILKADGTLDPSFNATATEDPEPGMKTYDAGGEERFLGVAVSPNGENVVAVGYSQDGDAAEPLVVVLPLTN